MKKSQRIKVIVELNADNEKKALTELGITQTKKKELQTQLESLQQYRQEYQDQYQTVGKTGVNISQLMEFRSFISKLDQAIEDQYKALADMENEATLAKKTWERQHHKTKSLQKVCDTALADEIKRENKGEQNEQDDRSRRRFSDNDSGTGNA